jgi:ribonuclease HI
VIRLTAAKLRTRKAKTRIKWVEGHSRDPGNEAADKLADKGEKKEAPDIISNRARRNLAVHGAKLAVMTQSLAYRIIRQIKMEKDGYQDSLDRNGTRRNMELAKGAAEDNNNEIPSTKGIRRSTQHKDISRNIRAFMWMNLHSGHKVGEHSRHITNHEEKEICQHCDITEMMQHILTQCDAPGHWQEMIWDMASELWQLKTGQKLRPAMGEIYACGLIKRGDAGTSRLFRIVVSESAHLIWRIRNERVIDGKTPASTAEIQNRISDGEKPSALGCSWTAY